MNSELEQQYEKLSKKVHDLREYPVDFAAQELRIRCPVCDEKLGQPTP